MIRLTAITTMSGKDRQVDGRPNRRVFAVMHFRRVELTGGGGALADDRIVGRRIDRRGDRPCRTLRPHDAPRPPRAVATKDRSPA